MPYILALVSSSMFVALNQLGIFLSQILIGAKNVIYFIVINGNIIPVSHFQELLNNLTDKPKGVSSSHVGKKRDIKRLVFT